MFNDFPNDPPHLKAIRRIAPYIETQRQRTRAATGMDATAIILPCQLDPGIHTLSETGPDTLHAGVVLFGLPVVFGAYGPTVSLIYDVPIPVNAIA